MLHYWNLVTLNSSKHGNCIPLILTQWLRYPRWKNKNYACKVGLQTSTPHTLSLTKIFVRLPCISLSLNVYKFENQTASFLLLRGTPPKIPLHSLFKHLLQPTKRGREAHIELALLSLLPERKRKLQKKRSTRLVLLSLFSLLSSLVSVHLSRKTRNPIFFLLLFETIDFSERAQSISNLQCHTLFMILCFIASLFLWSSVFSWFSVPIDLFHSVGFSQIIKNLRSFSLNFKTQIPNCWNKQHSGFGSWSSNLAFSCKI